MTDDAEELIQDHLAGALDAAGVARLEAWLLVAPAHRERFVRACRFHADLRQLAADRISTATLPAVRPQRRPWPDLTERSRWPWLAAAASLLVAVGIWWAVTAGPVANVQLVAGVCRSDNGRRLSSDHLIDGMVLVIDADAVLRWRDGSRASCAAGSRIAVRDDGLDLFAGICTAQVMPRGADRPFAVQGRHARVEVLGTRFTVVDDAVGTAVAVAEGRVRVRDRQGAERLVDAGQGAQAGPAGFAAAVLPVAPNEGPGRHTAFQQAVDAARPGDRVLLLPGRHGLDREVLVRRSGTAAAPLVISALPGAEVVCRDWNGLHVVDAAWIRIEGLRIAGIADGSDAIGDASLGNGIRIERSHHLAIVGCTITGCGGDGIACSDSDHITITGNRLARCGARSRWGQGGISINNPVAVDAAPGSHLTIAGNRITGTQTRHRNVHGDGWTGGNAIGLFDVRTGDPFPHRILVSGNQLAGNAGSAVLVSGLRHVEVVDNVGHRNGRLPDHAGAELMVNAEDCRLERNLLVPSPGRAPWLIQRRTGTVRSGNQVWGSGATPDETLDASPYAQPVADEDRREDFTRKPDADRSL